MKTSLRVSLIAAAIAALPFSAYAAGLGRLNVFSVLGQPLRAEVEVSGSAEEIESLSARLASPDAFRRANIDYSATLASLRIAVERRPTGAILKLSSDKPLSEPFVDMLLELNWAGGRLVREYTFLLDPAESRSEQAPATQYAPTPQAHPTVRHEETAPRAEGRRTRRAAAKETAAAKEGAAAKEIATEGDYKVKSGDSLSRIARELKPSDASPEQMLAALYGANLDSFPKGNINRLKLGQTLKVPAADQVKSLSAAEVKRLLSSSANFSAYRQKLAAAAAGASAKESVAQQSSAGKITPKSEEPTRAPEQKDRLKISKNQISREGAKADKGGRVQALEEDLVAKEKSLKDAGERVAALEKNVKDLQKLLELKNQSLADLQKQSSAKAAKPAETPKPVKPVAEASKPASEAKAEAASSAPHDEEQTAVKPAESLAQSAPAASAPVAVAKPAPVKPKVHASAPVEAPAEEPGFFAGLLGDPMLLGGIGAALLGIGGLFAYRARKRREESDMTALSASQAGTESVIGLAGGQTVDTGTSVLPTDFSQSGLYSIDADEGVDPVAEADVYMAYGRDAQAEEILLDALKTDPSRSAIHLKLLEVYALRKSLKQFENIATDLYTQTGGEGPEWAKTAEMGRKLDPENALYRQGGGEVSTEEISFVEPGKGGSAVQAPLAQSDLGPETEPSESSLDEVEPLELDFPEDLNLPPPADQTASFVPESGAQMQATWTMPGEVGQITRELPDAIQAAAEAPKEVKSQDLGLDFNLDLDVTPETGALTDTAPLAFAAAAPSAARQDLAFESAAKPVEAQSPLTLDLDGFDLPADATAELGVEPAYDAGSNSVVDLEKTSMDVGPHDFDFDISALPVEEATPAQDRTIDLSQINLDLPQAEAHPQAVAESEGQLLDEEINVDQEVETKLELARAYEEMRDFEGARELLEEVLQDGSSAQKQEAESIIARLA
ncbi:FimV/HubP family polar landmark protein [Niveibacterium terrae]|uniref:FimV/HubP family polar landmark protein n=1 Tax=Niveibacterium terrae TaxID=3373598 RepID=UPI003A918622